MKRIIISILIFIITCVLETYFLTTETFNVYIIPFKRTFGGEVLSIIGNIAILGLITLLIFALCKKTYRRIYIMGIVSIVLSIVIYALRVYSRYYSSFFSFRTLTVFKNPAANLGLSIVKQSLIEYFTSWSFLLMIPGIFLIIYGIKMKKKPSYSFNNRLKSFKFRLGCVLLCMGFSFISLYSFEKKAAHDWPYNSDLPLYGVQHMGTYNYYVYELFGANFQHNYKKMYDEMEAKEGIKEFNRADADYENFLGGSNNEIVYKGAFAGKNLYLIQLESINTFAVNLEIKGKLLMPNIQNIIHNENTYYFKKFYTSAGQGNTADAELSLLTGTIANGSSTLHWDYEKTKFEFAALPKLFKERYGASCYSFHGDTNKFYNRTSVHEEMFGFDKYYALEDYLKTNPGENQDPSSFINGWVADDRMLEWADEFTTEEPYLLYNIMTVSHTPYIGNPLEKEVVFHYDSTLLNRYLAYMVYVDNYLGEFFETIKNDEDTIYVFMSDHGCGLNGKPLKELFPKMDKYEQLEALLQVPAFIYDGSGTLNALTGGKMEQTLLRSQIDLFTTIVDLFDLPYEGVRLGVNGFSNEKTFTYNPSYFLVITDDYLYSVKNNKCIKYNAILSDEIKRQIRKIKKYKLYVEVARMYNLFQ